MNSLYRGKKRENNLLLINSDVQQMLSCMLLNTLSKKNRLQVALWGFSTLRPFGLLYSYPQQVPAFISRGATHHTDARDFYQRRRELLPMNFASKSVIHENPLGSFTCPQSWDMGHIILLPLRRKAY